MTYGWALLVLLVAIAALSVAGIIRPEGLLPSYCTFGPGVSCDDCSRVDEQRRTAQGTDLAGQSLRRSPYLRE